MDLSYITKDLKIPLNLRKALQRPLGRLIRAKNSNIIERITEIVNQTRSSENKIVTVGDVVSSTLIEAGLIPDIAIIDLKTKRTPITPAQPDKFDYMLTNPPGIIKKEVWSLLANVYLKMTKPITIYVDGEEDLLAIPASLLAPDGSIILYGQPDEGIVIIHANKETKRRFQEFLLEMEEVDLEQDET